MTLKEQRSSLALKKRSPVWSCELVVQLIHRWCGCLTVAGLAPPSMQLGLLFSRLQNRFPGKPKGKASSGLTPHLHTPKSRKGPCLFGLVRQAETKTRRRPRPKRARMRLQKRVFRNRAVAFCKLRFLLKTAPLPKAKDWGVRSKRFQPSSEDN